MTEQTGFNSGRNGEIGPLQGLSAPEYDKIMKRADRKSHIGKSKVNQMRPEKTGVC